MPNGEVSTESAIMRDIKIYSLKAKPQNSG